MADTDYKSSTPVRSEADGAQARVQVKLVDKTNPDTQQMTVDTDSNAHVESHGNNPAGTDTVLLLSEQGSSNTDGVYNATTNSIPATNQGVVSVRGSTVDKTSQTLRQTGVRTGNVNAADVSIYDETGTPFSASNPLPVYIADVESVTQVHSQVKTTVAVVSGTPQVATYTVATSTLKLAQLVVSASGACKFEIAIGASGTPPTIYTLFNSETQRNIILPIPKNFNVAVAQVVQCTFTSLEPAGAGQSFTGYLTVEGDQ